MAAILDGPPTRPEVLESSEADSIIREVERVAFGRLLEIGEESAVSAHAQTAILDPVDPWSAFLAASARGDPTLAHHPALQQSDPEGYVAIQSELAVSHAETQSGCARSTNMVSFGLL